MRRKTAVYKKIRSEEGASFSVALLFFLVCAMVGSSIVAAAASSMGRMKELSVNEKEKNAVYSAARLIARRMGGQNLVDAEILPKILDSSDGTASSGTASDGTASDSIVYDPAGNTLTVSKSFTFYEIQYPDGRDVLSADVNADVDADADGTDQADSDAEQYPNETLPESPFHNLDQHKISSLTDFDFTGYEKVRAGQIIDYFWNNYVLSGDAAIGQSASDSSASSGDADNWSGDNVPSSRTWMYGISESDGKTAGAPTFLNRQTYVLNVQEGQSDQGTVSVCIDLYMDKNFNLEAQIYPKTDSNGSSVSFRSASNRCLVKIPANVGTLQYTQDKSDPKLINKIKVNQDGDAASTEEEMDQDAASAGTEAADQDGDAASTEDEETDQDKETYIYIYEETITRKVTLSDFGWGNAKVYTGPAIIAQNPAGT